jgi:hypothetical protein
MPIIRNQYGEQIFKYILKKFLEKTCIQQITLSFVEIRKFIIKNINSICNKLILTFEKFYICYKKYCYEEMGLIGYLGILVNNQIAPYIYLLIYKFLQEEKT